MSVHASAANLAWHDGGLVTLHGPGDLGAPFAAAVPAGIAARLQPGALVERRDGALNIGGLTLSVGGAEVVDAAMPRAGARISAGALLAAAARTGRSSAIRAGLGHEACAAVAEGLALDDPALLLRGARGLIGLGPGLTPAGDDCLVGVLAMMHRARPAGLVAAPGVRTGMAALLTRTTAVAAEFLRHAIQGLFAEPLLALATADTEDGAHAAARRLCRRGATSGADTLAGIALALAGLGRGRDEPSPGGMGSAA